MKTEFTITAKVPSTANLREHWGEKATRMKAQKRAAMLKCPRYPGPALLVVTLTRVAPRELDGDNLQSALKAYRDGIARRLGVDDGSRLVRWEYLQASCAAGEECLRVSIRLEAPHE